MHRTFVDVKIEIETIDGKTCVSAKKKDETDQNVWKNNLEGREVDLCSGWS